MAEQSSAISALVGGRRRDDGSLYVARWPHSHFRGGLLAQGEENL